jgi:hypothetical protein
VPKWLMMSRVLTSPKTPVTPMTTTFASAVRRIGAHTPDAGAERVEVMG